MVPILLFFHHTLPSRSVILRAAARLLLRKTATPGGNSVKGKEMKKIFTINCLFIDNLAVVAALAFIVVGGLWTK